MTNMIRFSGFAKCTFLPQYKDCYLLSYFSEIRAVRKERTDGD